MAAKRPQGQYRTEPSGDGEPRAYVIDGSIASYVDEATYRAKRYQPDFAALPTKDEYDA